jgi:hypothetical protein
MQLSRQLGLMRCAADKLAEEHQRFGGTCCLHPRDKIYIMKMKAVRVSLIRVTIYQTAQRHILEEYSSNN